MSRKKKEIKKTTTVAIELSVYTELESMKIIPAEPFSDVIQRVILENKRLKGEKTEERYVRAE
jgi:predicted CopG family antitoxin